MLLKIAIERTSMKKTAIRLAGFSAAILAFVTVSAQADVTIKESYKSDGFMGIGALQGTTAQKVQGLDAVENSNMHFNGALMSLLAGGKKSQNQITIIHVNEDKRWSLNTQNKTYTETAISALKNGKKSGSSHSSANHTDPSLRLKKTSFKVTPTDEEKTINGFKTRRYDINFLMEMENTKTKQVSSYKMKSDLWAAPWTSKLRKAQQELESFNAAYMKESGMIAAVGANGQSLGLDLVKMMTHSNDKEVNKGLSDFKRQMSQIQGFPIEIGVQWYASQSGSKNQTSAQENSDNNANAQTPDIAGGFQGLASSLLGGLAKNAVHSHEKSKKQAGDAEKPMISIRTIIASVSVSPLPKKDFEVPSGYQQQ